TVVDGDGLTALGADVGRFTHPLTILTPHDGEYERLIGRPPGVDRVEAARALARLTNATVLLKGETPVIADYEGRALLVTTGDARLATAGTGDVLSGIIGGLLAQAVHPLRATAAVRGGASWLGVALVTEAIDVRVAGGLTEPVLVLAEPPLRQLVEVAQLDGVRPTLYTAEAIEAAAAAVRTCGRRRPLPVHLKVDTGMHRVGASPEAVRHLAEMIVAVDELELEGVWTHLAAAEDPVHDDYTARQLATFEDVRRTLAQAGIVPPMVHASNSGGVLAHPEARYDLVRCGIAIYGIAPRPHMPHAEGLRAAMSLKARVSYVKRVKAGEAISYGL